MGIAAYAAIASAAVEAYGAYQNGKSAKEAGAANAAAAAASGEAGKAFVFDQLGRLEDFGKESREIIGSLEGAFQRSDNAFSFADQTGDLFNKLFGAATDQKRENLDFILGDTNDDLRKVQSDNAALAAGNFSGFLSGLRADTLGVLDNTEGRPLGAFENLSARNQLLARSRGLSNSLSINDFFAREGTIDPPDPTQVFGAAQGIAEFEANENDKFLAFQERQVQRALALESSLFSQQFETNKLGLLSEANALQGAASSAGVGSAALAATLNGIGGAISTAGSAYSTYQSNKQSQANTERLIRLYEQQRSETPSLTSSTGAI